MILAKKASQQNRHKKNYLIFFLISIVFLIGLHLRLTAVLESDVIHPIRADAKEYIHYAINIHKHGIYSRSTDGITGKALPAPDAARPPVYPLFLTLFLTNSIIKTITLTNIQLIQACLSAITIILTYGIFSPILGKIASITIATLVAISPHLININIYLLSESLFGILLIFFFWLLSKSEEGNNKTYFLLLLGILLGISSLTRSWLQYFILFLIPLVFYSTPKKYRLKKTFLLSVAFSLTMGTWMLRNFYILGSISNDSVMIFSILHGIYPDLMYKGNPLSYGAPYRYDPNTATIIRSLSSLLEEITFRFQNSPREYLKWYLIDKPLNLFSWNYIQGMGDTFIYPVQKSPYFTYSYFQWSHTFMKATHTALMSMALLGSILAWFPQNKTWFSNQSLFILRCISLLIVYFTLLHMLVAPLPRYAVPIKPLLYGMAVYPFIPLFNWIRGKLN